MQTCILLWASQDVSSSVLRQMPCGSYVIVFTTQVHCVMWFIQAFPNTCLLILLYIVPPIIIIHFASRVAAGRAVDARLQSDCIRYAPPSLVPRPFFAGATRASRALLPRATVAYISCASVWQVGQYLQQSPVSRRNSLQFTSTLSSHWLEEWTKLLL